jgi:hypothetical protein
MANANAPRGFVPQNSLNSGPYNAGVRAYSIPAGDATALGINDPVKLAGTGQTIRGQVYADVIQAATGDRVLGTVVGFEPDPTNLSLMYRAASTQRIVHIRFAEGTVFECQEVSGGTALTVNDIGLNVNFIAATPNTTTGLSGFTLNNATEATTNTLDCQLVGFVQREDNAIGDSAKWLVRFNKIQNADQVAGV